MKDNPLVKRGRYQRIYDRRLEIMKRLGDEIYRLEYPHFEIGLEVKCYSVAVNYKSMPRERRKYCKRLRSVRYKLSKSTNELYREIRSIESRSCKYKYDDFTWGLFKVDAAAV